MLNNFDRMKSFLQFDSEDDFYFMQLIQRRKENPKMNKNSRALKSYAIRSMEQMELYKPDIIALCDHFNARATIRVNRRSFKQCAFDTLRELAGNLAVEDYRPVDKVYTQVMGKSHKDPKKKWILDVDDILHDDPRIGEISQFIEGLQPEGNKVVAVIPSRSGSHIITTGFNPLEFKKKYPEIEIIKDGPTNIYIP